MSVRVKESERGREVKRHSLYVGGVEVGELNNIVLQHRQKALKSHLNPFLFFLFFASLSAASDNK